MKCGYSKCKRQFTPNTFYLQRYCNNRCRQLARNERYRRRYKTNKTLRMHRIENARAYRRWRMDPRTT